ncbi:MAG TPA: hypothetical protein VGE52_09695 [Pirellulales bacterium]
MKLRFSMRWLLGGFLLSVIVVGWMALNVRRYEQGRAFLARNEWVYSSSWPNYSFYPIEPESDGPVVDFLNTALGRREFQTSFVLIGEEQTEGYMFAAPKPPAPLPPDFDAELSAACRELDSLPIRPVTLTFTSATCPTGLRDVQWVRHPTVLMAAETSLVGFPFERLDSLETLHVTSGAGRAADFAAATFPKLEEAVLAADWLDSAVLARIVTSPRLRVLVVGPTPLRPNMSAEERLAAKPQWSDADLQVIGNCSSLETLELGALKLTGAGLAELHRCRRLREIELLDLEVHTSLDPLLAHPTAESITLSGNIRGASLPTITQLGPALTKLDATGTLLTPEMHARLGELCAARRIEFHGGETTLLEEPAPEERSPEEPSPDSSASPAE